MLRNCKTCHDGRLCDGLCETCPGQKRIQNHPGNKTYQFVPFKCTSRHQQLWETFSKTVQWPKFRQVFFLQNLMNSHTDLQDCSKIVCISKIPIGVGFFQFPTICFLFEIVKWKWFTPSSNSTNTLWQTIFLICEEVVSDLNIPFSMTSKNSIQFSKTSHRLSDYFYIIIT